MLSIYRDHRGVEFFVDNCRCGRREIRIEYSEKKYRPAFVEGCKIIGSILTRNIGVSDYSFQCVGCGSRLNSNRVKVKSVNVLNRLEVV